MGAPRNTWPFIALLATLLLVLWLLVFMDTISFAYEQLGLSPEQALLLLLASLAGSGIDLPVARVESKSQPAPTVVSVFGMQYVVPRAGGGSTLIAVNVGGALIPTGFSVWLVLRDTQPWWEYVAAIAVVAAIVHLVARPVAGVGIVVPSLVPPLVAAAAAYGLAGTHAAPIAYVAGTLGTLLGADLSNLRRIPETGASVGSIGGAGTFDAVFLSGVMAVLLAALL